MAGSILDEPLPGAPAQAQPKEPTPRTSILDAPPRTSETHQSVLDAAAPAGKTIAQRMASYIPQFDASLVGPDSPFPKLTNMVINDLVVGIPSTESMGPTEALRGSVKELSLGTVDIGKRTKTPESFGDRLWQTTGELAAAPLFPLGPAVRAAPKIRGAKTIAGALTNMAATEVQNKFEASNRQLALSGIFGALFGRFYRGEPTLGAVDMAAAKTVAREAPAVAAAVPESKGPLLLEDFSTPQSRAAGNRRTPDFYASQAQPGPFPYETTGLHGERVLPSEYVPPGAANVDILKEPYSVSSVEGPGLFKELGVKAKKGQPKIQPGMRVELYGKNAQAVLNKMKIHPDADVRAAGKAAQTFVDNSQDIDTTGLQNTIEMAKQGKLPRDGLNIRLGQDPYVDPREIRTGLTLWTRNFRSPEYAMAGVETKSGGRIPAYETFWNAQTARGRARVDMTREGAIANRITKGMANLDNVGGLAYISTPPELKGSVANSLGMSRDSVARSQAISDQIKPIWNRVFPDTPWEKYIHVIFPAMRNESRETLAVLRNDPAMSTVEKWAANHEVNYQARGLRDFAASHIRALAMKEHFDGEYDKLMDVAGNKALPPVYREYVRNWAQGLRGTRSIFGEGFSDVYVKAWARVGVKADPKDMGNIVNNFIALSQTGMIGFKPSTILKAAFHPLMTGSRIGNSWMWYGLKKGLTQAGRAMGEAAGMHDTPATEMGSFQELQGMGGFSRGVKGMAASSLAPLGTLRDYARRSMYIAGHDRFLDAVKKGGTRDEVIANSGLLRFHPAIRDHVMERWAARDNAGAAHLMGVHAAQATQWEYTGEFRPVGLQSNEARAFTQMGIWPLNYVEYMRQMITLPIRNKTEAWDRVKWFAETGMNQATIVGMMTALGATVGLKNEAFRHTSEWVGYEPGLNYKGSPALDLISNLPKLASGFRAKLTGGEKPYGYDQAWRAAKRDLITAIPFSGVATDFAAAHGPIEKTVESVLPLLKGLRSEDTAPSKDVAQELFRFTTGTRVKQ